MFIASIPDASRGAAGARRKRRQVAREGRRHLSVILVTTCLIGLAGLSWAWASGWASAKHEAILAWGIEKSIAAGLTVREIKILGLEETSRESALRVLAIQPGAPILAFDPESAKAAVETLPWVRRAAIERLSLIHI